MTRRHHRYLPGGPGARVRGARYGQSHADSTVTVRHVEPTAPARPPLDDDLRAALRAGAVTVEEAEAAMRDRLRAQGGRPV